jgi:hypothetical protein
VGVVLEPYSTPRHDTDREAPTGWRDDALWPRAEAEQLAQRSALRRMAERKRDEEGARVIVFGHTHEPVEQELGGGATFLNCGTWTWTLDVREDRDAWKHLRQDPEPYLKRRRLTYVRVDYAADGEPKARLMQFDPTKPRSQRRPRIVRPPARNARR